MSRWGPSRIREGESVSDAVCAEPILVEDPLATSCISSSSMAIGNDVCLMAMPFPVLHAWYQATHLRPLSEQIRQTAGALQESKSRTLWKAYESPTHATECAHSFWVWMHSRISLTRRSVEETKHETLILDLSFADGPILLEWNTIPYHSLFRILPTPLLYDGLMQWWTSEYADKDASAQIPVAGFADISPLDPRFVETMHQQTNHVQPHWICAWLTLSFLAHTKEDVDLFFVHMAALLRRPSASLFLATWNEAVIHDQWQAQARAWAGTARPGPLLVGHSQACWREGASSSEAGASDEILWQGGIYPSHLLPWVDICASAERAGLYLFHDAEGVMVWQQQYTSFHRRRYTPNVYMTCKALRYSQWKLRPPQASLDTEANSAANARCSASSLAVSKAK